MSDILYGPQLFAGDALQNPIVDFALGSVACGLLHNLPAFFCNCNSTMERTSVARISPQKRRQLRLSGHPAPILQTKRLDDVSIRLPCDPDTPSHKISLVEGLSDTSPIQEAMLYTMNMDPQTGNVPDNPSVAALIPASSSLLSYAPGALSVIEKESHEFRQQLQDRMSTDKGTEVAYSKHLQRYEDYWTHDQKWRAVEAQKSGSHWEIMDPHPITATKVSIFLEYESTRNKVCLGIIDIICLHLISTAV